MSVAAPLPTAFAAPPTPRTFSTPLRPADAEVDDVGDMFDLDELDTAVQSRTPTPNGYWHQDSVFMDDDEEPMERDEIERWSTSTSGSTRSRDGDDEVERATTPSPHSRRGDDSSFYDDDDDEVVEVEELERAATPTPYNSRRDHGVSQDDNDKSMKVEEIGLETTPTPYSSGKERTTVEDDTKEAVPDTINDDEPAGASNPSSSNCRAPDNPSASGSSSKSKGSGRKPKSSPFVRVHWKGIVQESQSGDIRPKPIWVTLVSSDGVAHGVYYGTLMKAESLALQKSLEGRGDCIHFLDPYVERADVIDIFTELLKYDHILLSGMVESDMVIVDRLIRFFLFLLTWGCDKMRNRALEEVGREVRLRLGLVARFILGAALDQPCMCLVTLLESLPKPKDPGFSMMRSALAPLSEVGTLRGRLPVKYRLALDEVLDARGCTITLSQEKVASMFRHGINSWKQSTYGCADGL